MARFTQELSLCLSILLILAYGLSMLFSLKTHRDLFVSADTPRPASVVADRSGPGNAGVATVLIALVSDIFVESVQTAAEAFGMTPAFVGFIIVALVGAASAMPTAFAGARRTTRSSVGIARAARPNRALRRAVAILLSYVLGPHPWTCSSRRARW